MGHTFLPFIEANMYAVRKTERRIDILIDR
jgi:hypothetical protein